MGQGPSSPRRQYEEAGRFCAELGGNMQSIPTAESVRVAPLPAATSVGPANIATSTRPPALSLEVTPASSTAAANLAAPLSAPAAAAAATVPAPAATQQPGVPAQQQQAQPGQQPQQRGTAHKSTALIPGWSRALSSQALQLECQKAHQPQRTSNTRDTYAVLELEVMKYVAYCGGITVKFRVDDLHYGPIENITWGLASTRACPALQASQQSAPQASPNTVHALSTSDPGPASYSSAGVSAPSTSVGPIPETLSMGPGSPSGLQMVTPANMAPAAASGLVATPSLSPNGQAGSPGETARSPDNRMKPSRPQLTAGMPQTSITKLPSIAGVPVDSVSRKPLYMISSASTHRTVEPGDVLGLELAPREDKQPVIMATLKLNEAVLLQSSLPCSIISSLQMYPFVTVLPGMSVSLHEATTPSPLYTWYSPMPNGAPETQLCELDTCVKYNTSATTPVNLSAQGCGTSVEFHGSTVFTSGRHRWTVQLDNYGPHPTHIYVGIVTSSLDAPTSNGSNILANVGGPLRALTTSNTVAGTSGSTAGALAPSVVAASGNGIAVPVSSGIGSMRMVSAGPNSTSLAAGSSAEAGLAQTVAAGPNGADATKSIPRPQGKWGAWMRLPGTNAANNANPSPLNAPPPPRDGLAHMAESSSAHCFITVDLDLNAGYVRFFRNGHLIVSAFTGVSAPVSPAIAFVQAPGLHCQAGLVNLTKLRQLDLRWNSENCSGDLRLNGHSVSKVSEVYGDYSTVLANQGFISGVHLWLIKVNNLSEPDSIFIGVCRGCMPLDQDPQDLRDRTYYLSNGVIRVGGRRVATNAANFQKGDTVACVLDADQGEIIFFRNGVEQGRARGIRGRLYPFVSCDSEGDQITLLGSYSLLLNRIPRHLADMEWDTQHRGPDIELSSNCLTATKSTSNGPSTVRGTIQYSGTGTHEFHVILDTLGPDGVWAGVAPPNMDPARCVGDSGCGWALHSDGDKRYDGREQEFTQPFKNGDVLTVSVSLAAGTIRFARNGTPLGTAFEGVRGPLVAAVTMGSEESKVTIQNRPTVLNTGEYTGELRWDEARAGKDLNVIDGLTVTKMSNEGGDYATVLGTLCLASGQHSWNVYINHVEDSNLFIGVTVGGHDLNADPQEMKHRTYYLSNGTIRVAGKLITRCAEPYAEGDLISVQLDMDQRHILFLKNNMLQGAGDGLPDEVWPYVSLDNIMDSITLHSSSMFVDLAHSLRWNPQKASKHALLSVDGQSCTLRPVVSPATGAVEETSGQATVMGLREYCKTEVHSWIVRLEQQLPCQHPANFLVGVAPPTMELNRSLGEEHCGIGLDYFGYFYVNGRYFHVTNLSNWSMVAKPVRGSTAKHKGKAAPIFTFVEGKCEVTLTLDLKEGTLKFSHAGRAIGTIAGVKGPLHAAVTITSSRQSASLAPGPIGKSEHTNEELVNILKAKGCVVPPRLEAAMLVIPRDLFVPKDRHREAFRDQKVTVRMSDGSTMTLPPPSFVAMALEKLALSLGNSSPTTFLDVGCGTGYVTALVSCLVGECGTVHGIECVSSRLEAARSNMKQLRDRLAVLDRAPGSSIAVTTLGCSPAKCVSAIELSLSNVLIPECTDGTTYDAIYCDASLSEEDLPTFLSLLKPGGRMVVVIEEEALLVTRSANPHDFEREVITHVTGDFGELEDPTPWEVQEAISRIKERERRRGIEAARAEMAAIRSFEAAEMQQRVSAAMQRIGELEGVVARNNLLALSAAGGQAAAPTINGIVTSSSNASQFDSLTGLPNLVVAAPMPSMGSALRSPVMVSSPVRVHPAAVQQAPRSPMGGAAGASTMRLSGVDDVRMVMKDKSRRAAAGIIAAASGKPTPRCRRPDASGANASSDSNWDERERGAVNVFAMPGSLRSSRSKSSAASGAPNAVNSHQHSHGHSVADDEHDQATDDYDDDDLDAATIPVAMDVCGGVHVSMPQTTFDDLLDSVSTVQSFTVEQVEAMMVGGSAPIMVEGREVFMGTFKGVKVRVWKVPVSQSVSYLELRRAYSRYCISHPNITAVLGVCIQQATTSAVAWAEDDAFSGPSSAPASASTSRAATPQRPTHTHSGGLRSPSSLKPSSLPSLPLEDGSSVRALGVSAPQSDRQLQQQQQHQVLWVVEEAFGEESLHTRLERGLLSWQQVVRIGSDICKALAFLQDLRPTGAAAGAEQALMSGAWQRDDGAGAGPSSQFGIAELSVPSSSATAVAMAAAAQQQQPGVLLLSPHALRSLVSPANVQVDAQQCKLSMLPVLLNQLEAALGPLGDGGGSLLVGFGASYTSTAPLSGSTVGIPPTPLHCDMAYTDPAALFLVPDASTPTSFYAFGVVLLQLLTEQGPLGLLSAVREALGSGTLRNLVPRLPDTADMAVWAESFAALALRCTVPGGVSSLEAEVLPALEELGARLVLLGSAATLSWEQVEEMLMLPLQPRPMAGPGPAGGALDAVHRRWVRQDFRMRRKVFLQEVAKLAADGPVHKLEIRRNRCFKDSVAIFAGKGHAVWRQPLKVTFIGEAGMDSGGVTREWFSTLSSAISRGSPELFYTAGPQRNQLYVTPTSSSPAHLKKFAFVGLFMAKAILESAARGKELGPITLNLPLCEPFWKLLLGNPLSLVDLQQLDPTEFRSLMSILSMDIDGLIFENFVWSFQHPNAAAGSATQVASALAVAGGGTSTQASNSVPDTEASTPTNASSMAASTAAAAASPFACCDNDEICANAIALKPGGKHIKVTNSTKREYVLLKAHKMLVGAVEAQMSALIDAFHSLIPRDLLDKYAFSSLEMQLLVCGEQRIDIQDLKRHCKYEDGYTGKEDIISWFWEVAESFDDVQRRQLLQFWSGSDGMPAEGFGSMDPAFHMVAVERMYDPNDTTARLPAAHTCFRQLDLPRYVSREELREKIVCAITIGQGYMALS
ncbi:hypothetical protein VaNZ11_007009 [Volvox africanus]|uniref:HECT-type E3 ubiquitin transferase n=1 Tax=Volvox africanus TaxID=51714 RepID=A0ABQ5S3I8_9CHLO|nr:hypothetical protein VaNZ11_007009 [Volvox africanus]